MLGWKQFRSTAIDDKAGEVKCAHHSVGDFLYFVVKTCIFKETIWSRFSQAQALVVLVWVSWPKMVLTCFDHYVYCIIHYLHYFLVSELRQNSGSLQNRNWQKRWTWKNPRFLAARLGWCWLNGVKEGGMVSWRALQLVNGCQRHFLILITCAFDYNFYSRQFS